MAERDRSFGPVVLVGLASAGLGAVAATRVWATSRGSAAGLPVEASVTGAESQPLAAALALVALAAWGVVLVLRGATRRVVAVLGLVAAAAMLASVVLAFSTVQDDAVAAAVAQGASGDTFATGLTAWYWLTGVGGLLATLAFAGAVARAPRWPAMGSRYDAPAARREAVTDEDMWRALDEGHDPTS
jgi:uncharacterized membrane protein (TIGR02234 family)